jgi:hypothetical protein
VDAKQPIAVGPGPDRGPAGLPRERLKALDCVLVGVLGVDRLTPDGDGLRPLLAKVNLGRETGLGRARDLRSNRAAAIGDYLAPRQCSAPNKTTIVGRI